MIRLIVLTKSHTIATLLVVDFSSGDFIWDIEKELANVRKHGVDFITAAKVFKDPRRKFYTDSKHSGSEPRLFCIGKVNNRVVTVRFIYRHRKTRIFGAGYWRQGVRYYEQED